MYGGPTTISRTTHNNIKTLKFAIFWRLAGVYLIFLFVGCWIHFILLVSSEWFALCSFHYLSIFICSAQQKQKRRKLSIDADTFEFRALSLVRGARVLSVCTLLVHIREYSWVCIFKTMRALAHANLEFKLTAKCCAEYCLWRNYVGSNKNKTIKCNSVSFASSFSIHSISFCVRAASAQPTPHQISVSSIVGVVVILLKLLHNSYENTERHQLITWTKDRCSHSHSHNQFNAVTMCSSSTTSTVSFVNFSFKTCRIFSSGTPIHLFIRSHPCMRAT